jgi:thiosulfate dehydrogenase [quinone] large subunit
MAVNAMNERSGAARTGSSVRSMLTPAHAWAAMRLVLAWLFLWTFADKLLGLGFATEVGWTDGGSPTFGFMAVASHGVLDGLYARLGGEGVIDLLYMAAIGFTGLGLLLGIAVRLAALTGAAVQAVIWSTYLPPATNPFIDEHIFQAVALLGIAIADAGRTWGFGRRWERLGIVRRFPVLK